MKKLSSMIKSKKPTKTFCLSYYIFNSGSVALDIMTTVPF